MTETPEVASAGQATSPAAAGPGGELFEAKVGAYYLLAMLCDAEPRGLPGSRIERVQLQGASDGSPLDDVIIHAIATDGMPAILEIQAKRRITFSPADGPFRDTSKQIALALRSGTLADPLHHRVGIATAQGSRQIDGPYQEVLLWVRHSESPDAFFRKLSRVGASNELMRNFVATLRNHLSEFGGPSGDLAVWTVLRALQVLVFDFTAGTGQSESLARDRCVQALHPSDREKAGSLWSVLSDIAQRVATAGGEVSAHSLRSQLSAEHGLRLAGSRNTWAARAALAEASQNVLRDIRDRVGTATLSRRTRLDAINTALDSSGYVEILGDAGVGKSGLLRALAEQAAMGSTVVVLSPDRTIPRGWAAMRQAFGFEGSATEFLSEVAASGGATLFLDGVDFFEDAARATANDLVRAGAAVAGFKVVATGRRTFGTEERNWLADDALDSLGRSTVVIDELTDEELVELRSAAPELSPLLASGHPAREVVRNLFRLDRLANYPSSEPASRTEAQMAALWWRTGDGGDVELARERTRILRELALRALAGQAGAFNTSASAVAPLGQLLSSATLRDLGGERMIFRHDVFRDWAVANLLSEDSSKIESLPLTQLAPASLSRGIELAARFTIEDAVDDSDWKGLLDRLSQPGVHSSWRRLAVIALVRSEMSTAALDRAERHLLDDGGYLLRELIRMLMALEVAPAGRLLVATTGILPKEFAGLSIPTGPTWRRLATWLHARRNRIPANAIPEIAEFFSTYASAAWAFDPLARDLTAQLHAWLTEMELEDAKTPRSREPLFGGGLDYERHRPLHDNLRLSFVALSALQPDLADRYLRLLLANRRRSEGSEQVVKTPGNLAESAPKALAELTAAVLINDEPPPIGFGGYDRHEPFSHADRHFLSPSPARGPFLDLLVKSPKDGLALVRRLVLHACNFDSDESEITAPVEVEFEDGPKRFSCPGSYFWSRESQGQYCVTSALMSLEAWGHHRIDAGEDIETVVADILDGPELPAAYLLVFVDLVLSHWPHSRRAGIPFTGTPELLSWDRTRQLRERMGFVLGSIGEKEPRGLADRDSLKQRRSRQCSLEDLLPLYAFSADEEVRKIRWRLERAANRLGPYGPEASFADPRFMVASALNRLDRSNYEECRFQDKEGNEQSGFLYVAPEAEAEHLAPLQAEANAKTASMSLQAQLALAIEDPAKSSIELAGQSIAMARAIEASGEAQPDFDQSVLMAAALVMRDGDNELRNEHGSWAADQFRKALKLKEDPVHRMRHGLQFNPAGLAALGMTYGIRHDGRGLSGARVLLEVAASGDPAFAHGFGAALEALAAIDPRLPRSILRCAFVGNIRPRLRPYDPAAEDEDHTRRQEFSAELVAVVEAEWHWLCGNGREPDWPTFPEGYVSVRERHQIGGDQRREKVADRRARFYADHQAAAVWLALFTGDGLVAPNWLRGVLTSYRDWTSELNGAGLDRDVELSRPPREWNGAYFKLVSRSLSGLSPAGIDDLCVTPVTCIADEPFLDVMSDLLLSMDAVYFDAKGIEEADAVRVRTALSTRMQETSQWMNYSRRPGYGSGIHLNMALANLFFCGSGFLQPPRCYVTAIGMPRMPPFIPLLAGVAGQGPSLALALMAMSIVSVSPDYPFLEFGIETICACMKRFPDDSKLWLDYGVANQFCFWIDGVLGREGRDVLKVAGLQAQVEEIVSGLIRLGSTDASELERALLALG